VRAGRRTRALVAVQDVALATAARPGSMSARSTASWMVSMWDVGARQPPDSTRKLDVPATSSAKSDSPCQHGLVHGPGDLLALERHVRRRAS
jgi:hypothetical protein